MRRHRERQRVKVRPGIAAAFLEPPHELPHVLLPPQETSVSGAPSGTDSIARKYELGIEFADQLGEIAGFLAMIAIFLLPVGIGVCWALVADPNVSESLLLAILSPLLLGACLVMIREDFSGQKYNPVLFDKATGQVHVMDTKPLTWPQFFFMPWKAAGDQVIASFDWRCARAEVVTLQVFQGQIMRTEHNLVLAFTETPDSNKVVYRTAVGTTTAYDNGLGCINRWEHIRRYMRGEGPGLRGWDRPWGIDVPTFWRGFFFAQMLLGPGSGEYWRSKRWGVYLVGILSIPGLPFSAYAGLVRWACYAVRRKPEWPKNIRDALGVELSARAMAHATARGEDVA
jgi:hypothetical protein